MAEEGSHGKRASVVLFTGTFPYLTGEQFIEPEISHWSRLAWAKVTLCPHKAAGAARSIPDDIETFQWKGGGIVLKLWCAFCAFWSPLFWCEVGFLRSSHKLRMVTLRSALRAVTVTLLAKAKALRLVNACGHIDIAYCYWNAEQAYAACMLKREGKISCVVSRAHGYDLYEERHLADYMPLKRQFVHDFDTVYPIAEQGRKYLAKTYGFQLSALKLSRLGVVIPDGITISNAEDVVHVVSLSYCVKVKRIEKIISALALACKLEPERKLSWTHIGSGPLQSQLEMLALQELGPLSNASWRFSGALPNNDVLTFFASNRVDALINCSESEGVPVSIMEAMSYGIPAIAPAIGGIAELVADERGALLPRDFSPEDVAQALKRLTGNGKELYRTAAKQWIVENYCARTNFKEFIDDIRRTWLSQSSPGRAENMHVRACDG